MANPPEQEQPKKVTLLVHPKVIYWVDMPDVLQPKDRIELLKHDVLIKSVISEKIHTLHKENQAGYIVNLDSYLTKNRVGKVLSENVVIQRLLHILQNLNPKRTIVHTTMIDPNISNAFKTAGIMLVEKNLDSRKIIIPLIGGFISYLFRDDARLKRDFVRIELPPNSQTQVRVLNLRTSLPGIRGKIRDLSLNGIGMILENAQSASLFQLKDPVKLFFEIENVKFTIKMAFVARIHTPTSEVGFVFNIRNPNMISEEVATSYTSLIYSYLREVLHDA